jgi:hypothetical protein
MDKMMGKRSSRLVELAVDAARRSELQHHHGAVLFSHGGKRVHSFRCNVYRRRGVNYRLNNSRSMHAEAHALLSILLEDDDLDQESPTEPSYL